MKCNVIKVPWVAENENQKTIFGFEDRKISHTEIFQNRLSRKDNCAMLCEKGGLMHLPKTIIPGQPVQPAQVDLGQKSLLHDSVHVQINDFIIQEYIIIMYV